MAAVEPITPAGPEDQEKTSQSEDCALNETSTHLDFSELTPSQFGISIKSFTPSSSSTCKDKTRLAQIKARRRSSVGARGSPETNSLIRFIAQQRMKTPPAPQTAEPVRSSPFFTPVASTLRQKMANFQSLMDHVFDPVPEQDGDTGGCIMTRDYLSDGISCSEGKENNPPTRPTPNKKRRLGPLEGCSVEIRDVDVPVPLFCLKEQEEAVGQHQRPSRPASDDPAAALSPHQSSPPHIFPVSPHLEIKPSDDNSTETPVLKKKKQVHFGDPLSPEFFDKNLPPSTPLQKGGTPARAPTPGGSLQLRSVLKTPQTSESNTPHHQLELYSPSEFGASPTLAIPHKRRRLSEEADGEDGKIAFPAMEEFDSAMASDSVSECALDAQLLNVSMASVGEPLPQVLTELDSRSSLRSQMDFMDEHKSVPDKNQSEATDESPTPTRSSKRTRKMKQEPKSEPRARSCSRRRKPEESTPVKRSTRSAAMSACRKMKKASAARRWDKGVDLSLYGSRDYASKNPSLSPITERQSLSSLSPAAQLTLQRCTAPTPEPLTVSDVVKNPEADDGVVVKRATENAPPDSLTSPYPGQEGSRLLSSKVRRRQRKVSVGDSQEAQEQAGGQVVEQLFQDHTFSAGTPSESSEADTQAPAAASCTDAGTCLHTSTSLCPPSAAEPGTTELKQKRAKPGRRSSALHEPQTCPEEHQSSCDVEQNGLREQAERQPENKCSSDSQEEVGGAFTFVHLAPWQSDFNVEDVFKPAPRRGQRSVRRSLRNQHGSEQSGSMAGLSWLPHVSPDTVKEARRKTRHRRLSAALPVQTPEDAQDASLDGLGAAGDN